VPEFGGGVPEGEREGWEIGDMARPEKQGLDYFSHDVNPANDPRLEYIEAVHGVLG